MSLWAVYVYNGKHGEYYEVRAEHYTRVDGWAIFQDKDWEVVDSFFRPIRVRLI